MTGHRSVLLTVGRLPAALEIARAFHSAGWRVVIAEPMRWHLCRLSNAVAASYEIVSPVKNRRAYHQQLLEIVQKESITLVVPVSEEIMYVAQISSILPPGTTLLAMDSDTLHCLHDKWRFAQWALAQGLNVPPAQLASRPEAIQFARRHSFVVKPRLSCSGAGVVFGEAGASTDTLALDQHHVVQARLSGDECSSFAIAAQGKCLLLVTYRSLLNSASVSVCFERIATPDAVRELNEGVISRLAFSGMISFDFMCDAEQNWQAIECNPRATSGIHFLQPDALLSGLLQASGLAGQSDWFVNSHHQIQGTSNTLLPVSSRRQEVWSALTEVEGRLFKGRFNAAWWRQLFTTADISWSTQDPKPCLLMPFATWQLLKSAISSRKPISQVVMLDLGWYQAEPIELGAVEVIVRMTHEATAELIALVETIGFGSDGLRYRRLNVADQLARFSNPTFFSAYFNEKLVGVYVIDSRELMLDNEPAKGFYRGVLAVSADYQGQGVGNQLADAAMDWLDKQAQSTGQITVSYGCIDISNSRSLALLAKQGTVPVGNITMFMMYRQWPREQCDLAQVDDTLMLHYQALLEQRQKEFAWQDITQACAPLFAVSDSDGIRVAACVSSSAFQILGMSPTLAWVTKMLVKPWKPARKRFDPDNFTFAVFSQIVVREGCERDWPAFVSTVLARHGVHFGIVYIDPASTLFNQVLRAGLLGRWLHSDEGSLQVMAKLHGPAADDASAVADMSSLRARVNALYPVDG